MDINKIKFDLYYFIEKIKQILNDEIKAISFGIITTYNALSGNKRYANFKKMLQFCINYNYELLLFNTENNELFLNESKDINNLNQFKKIITLEEIPLDHTFCHKELFKIGKKIPQKMPIEKVKPSNIIQYIKNAFSKLFEININLDLVGKFISSISPFHVPEEYVIYYYKKEIVNKMMEERQYIYYKNRKIFYESKKQNKKINIKNEKIILVFNITIDENSIKEKFKTWLKKISEEKIDENEEENSNENLNNNDTLSNKEEEEEEKEEEEEEDPDNDEMYEIKEEQLEENVNEKMEEDFKSKKLDEIKENIEKRNIINQKENYDDINMKYEEESLNNFDIKTNQIDNEDYVEEEEEEKENGNEMDVEKEKNDIDNIEITELSIEEFQALIIKFNPIAE